VRDDEAMIGDVLAATAAVVKKNSQKLGGQGMAGTRKKGQAPSARV